MRGDTQETGEGKNGGKHFGDPLKGQGDLLGRG